MPRHASQIYSTDVTSYFRCLGKGARSRTGTQGFFFKDTSFHLVRGAKGHRLVSSSGLDRIFAQMDSGYGEDALTTMYAGILDQVLIEEFWRTETVLATEPFII